MLPQLTALLLILSTIYNHSLILPVRFLIHWKYTCLEYWNRLNISAGFSVALECFLSRCIWTSLDLIVLVNQVFSNSSPAKPPVSFVQLYQVKVMNNKVMAESCIARPTWHLLSQNINFRNTGFGKTVKGFANFLRSHTLNISRSVRSISERLENKMFCE